MIRLQVRDSADQARRTKTATELQALTQLNGLITDAQAMVDPKSNAFTRASEGKITLPQATNLRFGRVLRNMDYLAWLFDRGYITTTAARSIWGQRMKCFYFAALYLYGRPVRRRLTDLAQFTGSLPARKELPQLVQRTC